MKCHLYRNELVYRFIVDSLIHGDVYNFLCCVLGRQLIPNVTTIFTIYRIIVDDIYHFILSPCFFCDTKFVGIYKTV